MTARGNRRGSIYEGDGDRLMFLDAFGEMVERFGIKRLEQKALRDKGLQKRMKQLKESCCMWRVDPSAFARRPL